MNKKSGSPKSPDTKRVYFVTSYLEISRDLRGVPQVIFQLIRLFRDDPRLNDVVFVASKKLEPLLINKLGVPPGRVKWIEPLPILSRFSFLHGLFSTLRFRSLSKDALLIVHPELRTVMRTRASQVVLHHDFMQLYARSTSCRNRLRILVYKYKFNIALEVPYQIANSEHVRKMALRINPTLPETSIIALHLGMRDSIRIERDLSREMPERSFLYVGSIDDRKNVFALLENIRFVVGHAPFTLHLAGKVTPLQERRLQHVLESGNLKTAVVLHGEVEDAKLSELYAQSSFFLFPSLDEGFGLPMIEAMAHGTVVCAFKNSAIPEICGNAAVLSSNNDFRGWGKEIERLLENPDSYRAMSRRGRERAMQFTEESMFMRYGSYFASVVDELSYKRDSKDEGG